MEEMKETKETTQTTCEKEDDDDNDKCNYKNDRCSTVIIGESLNQPKSIPIVGKKKKKQQGW